MTDNLTKKLAMAIDGNSLSYRAYYATVKILQNYTVSQEATNAVKLMLIMCLKLRKMFSYDFAVVAFDTHAPTFRKLTLEKYKLNRKKMPSALVTQMPLIMESLNYLGFKVIFADGWEADDLIGSFVRLMTYNNVYTNIYSSDYDLLQLVSSSSSLFMPIQGVSKMKEYNLGNFSHLFYGLTPSQIPHYKALVGDSSDNYDGVKGIGKKTAIELLKKYQNLDGIFKNSLKLTKRQYQLLASQMDQLKTCFELSTIKSDYFHDLTSIESFQLRKIDFNAISDFLKKHTIRNLEKYFE